MEKTIKPTSGWAMLLVILLLVAAAILFFIMRLFPLGAMTLVLTFAFILPGFIAIEPNSSRVMTLFGSYIGSVKESRFFTNPFYSKNKVSLRAVTLDVPYIKVNDKQGNPIMIGGVVTYRVQDTFKAAFAVENYPVFVKIQSETALRKLAGMYDYDWKQGCYHHPAFQF